MSYDISSIESLEKESLSALPTFEELKARTRKPKDHMCVRCIKEYDDINEKQRKVDPEHEDVYPTCQLTLLSKWNKEQSKPLAKRDRSKEFLRLGSLDTPPVTKEEWADINGLEYEDEIDDSYEEMIIISSPNLWLAAELGILTDGIAYDREGDELNMDRWYQKEYWNCVGAETKVFMSDGTVKNIIDVKKGDHVVTYNENKRDWSSRYTVTKQMMTGVKDVYRIKLSNGDTLDCTDNHPILAHVKSGELNQMHNCPSYKTDYQTIEQGLKEGSKVYTMNRFGFYGEEDDEDLAIILGYLVTDGYINIDRKTLYGKSYTADLVMTNELYVKEFHDAVKRRFPNSSIRMNYTPSKVQDDGIRRKETWGAHVSGKDSGLIKFLESIGVTGKESREIGILEHAFTFSLNSLRTFINRSWSGYGSCYFSGQYMFLELASGNKEFLEMYRFLLKKIGIIKSTIKSCKDNNRSFVLRICQTQDVHTFFTELGLIYGKEENSKKCYTKATESIERNTNYSKKGRFNTSSRTKIVSIEYVGKQEVYDIEVSTRHNFVANGFIVHNCSSQFKVNLAGRRLGKTFSMIADDIYFLATNDEVKILLIAPYEKQLIAYYKEFDRLIKGSSLTCDRNKTHHRATFPNGSTIESISTGGDKAGGGAKARGQDADRIVFDEVDFIGGQDIDAALAVLADNPKVQIRMSSTPIGKREILYDVSTDKNRGYKLLHLPSHASPAFTKRADKELRSALSTASYKREILAEFGDEAVGVFSHKDLDASLMTYNLAELRSKGPREGCHYIVAADWNGRAIGTHIVVVELDPKINKYKVVDKTVVKNEAYTQNKSCEVLIATFNHWKCEYMYVDAGFGDTQIEIISKYAAEKGDNRLRTGLVPVSMQGMQEIVNPISGETEKKPNKEFAINLLANCVEEGRIILPFSEDYMGDDEDWGIVTQMRRYTIDGFTPGGRPRYSSTVDHSMTAFYLAIMGFTIKMSDLGKVNYDTTVGVRGAYNYTENKNKQVIDVVQDLQNMRGKMEQLKSGRSVNEVAGADTDMNMVARDVAFSGDANTIHSAMGVGVFSQDVTWRDGFPAVDNTNKGISSGGILKRRSF